jgi:4-amino-4-deoxy-L-arabinose transferase-like glycosyltransferase
LPAAQHNDGLTLESTIGGRADRKVVLAVLLFVVALGAGLRVYGITRQSLRNDELSSWVRTGYPTFAETISKGAVTDVHPPGYYAILYLVQTYLGDSETILRAPSVVAGILSIVAIFFLGRRLYCDRAGVVAAGLLAASWFPIYYSQDARPYAFLLLFSITTTHQWHAIATSLATGGRPSRSAMAGFVGSTIALAYTHYFGLLLVAVHGACALLLSWRSAKQARCWIFLYGIVSFAYVPWLPAMWTHLHKGTYITSVGPEFFITFFQWLFNKSGWIALGATAIYVAYFLFFRPRGSIQSDGQQPAPDAVSLVWLFAPSLIVYAKSILSTPVLTEQNLIIVLPPAYLLLARALIASKWTRWAWPAIAATVSVGMAIHLIFGMGYYRWVTKAQFREAAAYIAENDGRYDRTLIVGYAWNPKYFDYYFEKFGFERHVQLLVGEAIHIDRVEEAISAGKYHEIWFVRAHRVVEKDFLAHLEQKYAKALHVRFLLADVWLFRKKR